MQFFPSVTDQVHHWRDGRRDQAEERSGAAALDADASASFLDLPEDLMEIGADFALGGLDREPSFVLSRGGLGESPAPMTSLELSRGGGGVRDRGGEAQVGSGEGPEENLWNRARLALETERSEEMERSENTGRSEPREERSPGALAYALASLTEARHLSGEGSHARSAWVKHALLSRMDSEAQGSAREEGGRCLPEIDPLSASGVLSPPPESEGLEESSMSPIIAAHAYATSLIRNSAPLGAAGAPPPVMEADAGGKAVLLTYDQMSVVHAGAPFLERGAPFMEAEAPFMEAEAPLMEGGGAALVQERIPGITEGSGLEQEGSDGGINEGRWGGWVPEKVQERSPSFIERVVSRGSVSRAGPLGPSGASSFQQRRTPEVLLRRSVKSASPPFSPEPSPEPNTPPIPAPSSSFPSSCPPASSSSLSSSSSSSPAAAAANPETRSRRGDPRHRRARGGPLLTPWKHGLSTEAVPVSAYVGSSKNLKDLKEWEDPTARPLEPVEVSRGEGIGAEMMSGNAGGEAEGGGGESLEGEERLEGATKEGFTLSPGGNAESRR